MSTFHTSFLLRKSTATLLPTRYVLSINETFQMRYCMKFYLKGYQKHKKSNFWLSQFTSWIRSFLELLIWCVIILIRLEIKLRAVPHLKGLINGKNISGRQECVGIFMHQNGTLNLSRWLHKMSFIQFHSDSTVGKNSKMGKKRYTDGHIQGVQASSGPSNLLILPT